MEKATKDTIRCWLEENDASEGNIYFQGNLSDTDGESEHESECNTDTEQSDDDSARYDAAQHIDEVIVVQTIPMNTNIVDSGPTTQENQLESAFYTSKDGLTN